MIYSFGFRPKQACADTMSLLLQDAEDYVKKDCFLFDTPEPQINDAEVKLRGRVYTSPFR